MQAPPCLQSFVACYWQWDYNEAFSACDLQRFLSCDLQSVLSVACDLLRWFFCMWFAVLLCCMWFATIFLSACDLQYLLSIACDLQRCLFWISFAVFIARYMWFVTVLFLHVICSLTVLHVICNDILICMWFAVFTIHCMWFATVPFLNIVCSLYCPLHVICYGAFSACDLQSYCVACDLQRYSYLHVICSIYYPLHVICNGILICMWFAVFTIHGMWFAVLIFRCIWFATLLFSAYDLQYLLSCNCWLLESFPRAVTVCDLQRCLSCMWFAVLIFRCIWFASLLYYLHLICSIYFVATVDSMSLFLGLSPCVICNGAFPACDLLYWFSVAFDLLRYYIICIWYAVFTSLQLLTPWVCS